jgi:hypothetical protein
LFEIKTNILKYVRESIEFFGRIDKESDISFCELKVVSRVLFISSDIVSQYVCGCWSFPKNYWIVKAPNHGRQGSSPTSAVQFHRIFTMLLDHILEFKQHYESVGNMINHLCIWSNASIISGAHKSLS